MQLFDGKTLTGWDGNRDYGPLLLVPSWDETTPANPTQGNTFLIWRQGVCDFELGCPGRSKVATPAFRVW